jgi:hypothetical protein
VLPTLPICALTSVNPALVPAQVHAEPGAAAAAAIGTAAAYLSRRLKGATIAPAIRTPLERSITRDYS